MLTTLLVSGALLLAQAESAATKCSTIPNGDKFSLYGQVNGVYKNLNFVLFNANASTTTYGITPNWPKSLGASVFQLENTAMISTYHDNGYNMDFQSVIYAQNDTYLAMVPQFQDPPSNSGLHLVDAPGVMIKGRQACYMNYDGDHMHYQYCPYDTSFNNGTTPFLYYLDGGHYNECNKTKVVAIPLS